MTDQTNSTETPSLRALRELVEVLIAKTEVVHGEDEQGHYHAEMVSMEHPEVASAMREAKAVLGIKVHK